MRTWASGRAPSYANKYSYGPPTHAEPHRKLAEQYDIQPDLFHVTHEPNLVLTKVGAHIEVGSAADDLLEEEALESVKILQPNGASQPITREPSSLMRLLSDCALYRARAYVLLPPDRQPERAEIESRWAELMRDAGWGDSLGGEDRAVVQK